MTKKKDKKSKSKRILNHYGRIVVCKQWAAPGAWRFKSNVNFPAVRFDARLSCWEGQVGYILSQH